MFTKQSSTLEDTTSMSTEEPTSTTEVEGTSISTAFTDQDTTPEDVTIVPTVQNPIIKPAILTGIFSALLTFIGVYIFRRRKTGSYTIPQKNVSNVEPVDYQDVMETNV